VAQRFVCTRCGKYSCESQPIEGVRIEKSKVVQIVTLLCEGLGVRGAARARGVDPHTVLNVLETVGAGCERLHDRLARNVRTASLQIDELWAKVGCSQKNIKPSDYERGDFYTFLSLAAREKFILSYYTGKRDNVSTDCFVSDVASRVEGRIQITTDALA